jgi:hypothetical protein
VRDDFDLPAIEVVLPPFSFKIIADNRPDLSLLRLISDLFANSFVGLTFGFPRFVDLFLGNERRFAVEFRIGEQTGRTPRAIS